MLKNLQNEPNSLVSELELPIDAFVRSVAIKNGKKFAIFLGAGASITSGMPSVENCIWEWKRDIFLTNNPGLEPQFKELSLPNVRLKIQNWLDNQEGFPKLGNDDEYSFYIQKCYPIPEDRKSYFFKKIMNAKPHIGYHLLCLLAEANLIDSIWSSNFDGITAATATNPNYSIVPYEVGLDTKNRLNNQLKSGQLLTVSLHGDFRYDDIKNTDEELQELETQLHDEFIKVLREKPIIVIGYSGRDKSIMDTLTRAYSTSVEGGLFWCGYSENDLNSNVTELLQHAKSNGNQVHYVQTKGFEDLMIRISRHKLKDTQLEIANKIIRDLDTRKSTERGKFEIPSYPVHTFIKSNAFELNFNAEVLTFELNQWPKEKVWKTLQKIVSGKNVVIAPFKGKVIALGSTEEIKSAFGENIKGEIKRIPLDPKEFNIMDGTIVNLFRNALVRLLARPENLSTNYKNEIWNKESYRNFEHNKVQYPVHKSVKIFIRKVGRNLYLIMEPSIKVFDSRGGYPDNEVRKKANAVILARQFNNHYSEELNKWRNTIFSKDAETKFEFPLGHSSCIQFTIKRTPIFGKICKQNVNGNINLSDTYRKLLRLDGIQIQEPQLVFTSKGNLSESFDSHSIRGIANNRPFDYSLTSMGLSSSIRVGVICAQKESELLNNFLQDVNKLHQPTEKEHEYLVDYKGFQNSFGLPIEIPTPNSIGWDYCPEPVGDTIEKKTHSIANLITSKLEAIQSTVSPNVVIIFFPSRWKNFRCYSNEHEKFDVHDFVKAYAVQKGMSTQFIEEDTINNSQQCRTWWWLSLAIYVKGMRVPWVLKDLDEQTAYVGLGYSQNSKEEKGKQIVLGCSHIYNSKGEGLQYRLSKIENPLFIQRNPHLSFDDARNVGESIRQLFYERSHNLPNRVVIHKRTRFTKDESEGLIQGLSGISSIDFLEIQYDNSLRFLASKFDKNRELVIDGFPVRRGTMLKLSEYEVLLWVHGVTDAINNPTFKFFQGGRRIPTPLVIRRHLGDTPVEQIGSEILGLSKMDWNNFDLYSKMPATLQSSNKIAQIGRLLHRFGSESYDYRLFI